MAYKNEMVFEGLNTVARARAAVNVLLESF